ncbi:hypothetical protein [Waddlia chondrophila]|uniref:hypothetical protein n=1 Tax=Waddlia chondrophila TaxID=71667 RepID=UPI0005A50FA9|nr:hypothetical protein [Waddlia chondrophila]
MNSSTAFTLDGALFAKKIIKESYEFTSKRFQFSVTKNNVKQKQIWLERVLHLMGELNWVDSLILNLSQTDKADIYGENFGSNLNT